MASSSFAIDPSASIFRDVANGDNAISPSSLKNVIFDAYGLKIHGMSEQGVVPFSSFTGPVTTGGRPHPFFYWQYTFPVPLTYCPITVALFQTPGGAWVPVLTYSQTVSGITCTCLAVTTLTELTLIATSSSTAGIPATAQPLAASYRLFGV